MHEKCYEFLDVWDFDFEEFGPFSMLFFDFAAGEKVGNVIEHWQAFLEFEFAVAVHVEHFYEFLEFGISYFWQPFS